MKDIIATVATYAIYALFLAGVGVFWYAFAGLLYFLLTLT